MQGLVQYIMDTYTIYCASAIASTVILRSVFAATFPLISPAMYSHLGDQWAASVFAFLSLACTPLPFLFYVSLASTSLIIMDTKLMVVFAEIWSAYTEQVQICKQSDGRCDAYCFSARNRARKGYHYFRTQAKCKVED